MTTTVLPTLTSQRVTWAPRPVAPAVWCVRALIPLPFVLMAPEVVAAVQHRPDAMTHLSMSVANVMGNAIFLAFALMLTVTPLATITGWRWHIVLRRDLGLAMFAMAWTDLVLAAVATGDEFDGGVLGRVAGHSFLLVGMLATVLTLPLALTANRRSQRALGTYWKSVHRLTYLIWALILLHLLLLFGLRSTFLHAALVSAVLLLPRLPVVRDWWLRSRRSGAWRRSRGLLAVVLGSLLLVGLEPFAHVFLQTGSQAFLQHPVED
ncbi:MAG: hypothetical protein JWN31_1792 [Frankiales bacterium]|nr:hypothetical protein [Frankiales bacterium]